MTQDHSGQSRRSANVELVGSNDGFTPLKRSKPTAKRSAAAAIVPAASLTMLALSAVLSTPNGDLQAQQINAKKNQGRQLIEEFVDVTRTPRLTAAITPVDAFPSDLPVDSSRGVQPPCPPVVIAHTDSTFGAGSYILQLGMVADEIAAVSFVIPASEFPIIVRGSEMIFARNNTTVTTTTEWSWIVWEGTPANGTIVATFSSDGSILPHIVIPPGAGAQGVNVQVIVDPEDPEQVVVQNNGSNTFTVGYRIDAHNNPPTAACNGGLTPAACCPPPPASNAFPTVDVSGVANQANNWLYCRPNCGFLACPGGWHNFASLGAFRPSGDWVIRATYEPFDCDLPFGACCFLDGSGQCSNEFEPNCTSQGGTFMGDATSCGSITCPEPLGACCIQSGPGNQCTMNNEAQCAALNVGNTRAVWLGAGTTCSADICNDRGACCFTASCSDLSALNCLIAGGTFFGIQSDCAGTICNPFGACCMPDGSCTEMLGSNCTSSGGIFQGHQSLCSSTNCPQPQGACCLNGGGCFQEQQANCIAIPGATWAGMGTDCKTDCTTSTTGACCLDGGGCIIEEEANCIGIPGASFAGIGTNCNDDCAPDCPADLTGAGGQPDGIINVTDLFFLLANWNTNGPGADLAAPNDLVNVADLFALLAAWGDC